MNKIWNKYFHDSSFRSYIATITVIIFLLLILVISALARDDGRYAGSPLKNWFNELRSDHGQGSPCCSDADGTIVKNADWRSINGRYQVYLEGRWVDVPDDALVEGPNLFGQTLVWPRYLNGEPFIRCFMPGSMT